MMKNIKIIIGAVLALGLATQAHALSFGSSGKHLGKADTRGEAIEHATEHFSKMDDNSNGKIEMSEMGGKKNKRSYKYEIMLKRLDSNGDNVITQSEFIARAVERFDLVDTNNDGSLSDAERDEARNILRAEGIKQRFEDADENSDGVLSLDEYTKWGSYGASPRGGHRGDRR